jgi:hypothetical protein
MPSYTRSTHSLSTTQQPKLRQPMGLMSRSIPDDKRDHRVDARRSGARLVYKLAQAIENKGGERTLTHPWFGIGVDSTPVVRDEEKAVAPAEQPEGLGAVGAVLLALAGAAVVMLIPCCRLRPSPSPRLVFQPLPLLLRLHRGCGSPGSCARSRSFLSTCESTRALKNPDLDAPRQC